MKQLWCAMSLMAGSLFFSVNASADTSSGALLQQMNLASQSLNYELSFVSISKQGVESLRYRHARLNNQPLAQLLQLDGPRREVVLRGTEISYFEPGLDPFTLNGDYIVDSLPSLVYSDFKRLSAAYDFISVGRTRIADRLCDVIRVVARDGTRYSFIAWLDAETKLPLRVDRVLHGQLVQPGKVDLRILLALKNIKAVQLQKVLVFGLRCRRLGFLLGCHGHILFFCHNVQLPFSVSVLLKNKSIPASGSFRGRVHALGVVWVRSGCAPLPAYPHP